MNQTKNLLRSINSLKGPFPKFNTSDVPDEPTDLFVNWLTIAIDKGVPEAHAMTLSTVDKDGKPDARVLILKNVTPNNWYFATSATSRKGEQLEDNPNVSLTFYWKELGRQVRIRGIASNMGFKESSKDFLERSSASRASALIGKPSKEMNSRDELERSLAEAKRLVELDPQVINPNWKLYAVYADEIEFWQGDPERKHTRLQYQRDGHSWKRRLLWP